MRIKKRKWFSLVAALILTGCADDRDRTAPSVDQLIDLSQRYLEKYHDTDDVVMTAKAESVAREAVDKDSTAAAVVQLARVKIATREYEEAASLLGGVIRYDPSDAGLWGLLGDALFAAGKYRNADSSYHVMYEIDDGFYSLGRIAARAAVFDRFEVAIDYLDRAIAGATTSGIPDRSLAGAYTQLAGVFFSHGYLEAALTDIDRAIELLPDVVPSLVLKADILRAQGDDAESIQIYERLVDLSPHPFYKSRLAMMYADRGEVARADSLVQLALDHYDRLSLKYFDIIAGRYIEHLLDWKVDPKRGLKLAYAQSRKRRDIYSYELLAWAYLANGDYELAWSSISLALRTGAKDPRIVYRASVIAKAAGKQDKYRIFGERARELNPMAEAIWGRRETASFK